MKEAYYFSHDMNARNDPKIKAMMGQYGRRGYGWFWMFIETLAEQSDYMLPCKKWAYASVASDFDCSIEEAQAFISDLVSEYELLVTDGVHVWSESLMRRMVQREAKQQMRKDRASKAGRVSADQRELNTENNVSDYSSQEENDSSTLVEHKLNSSLTQDELNSTKERKGKERKEKKLFASDSVEFQLASLLLEKIREWHPKYREPDLHAWADGVRLMIQQDKIQPANIEKMICWCQSDDFWRPNVLSIPTLRKQWPRLEAKVKSDSLKQQPRAAPVELVQKKEKLL